MFFTLLVLLILIPLAFYVAVGAVMMLARPLRALGAFEPVRPTDPPVSRRPVANIVALIVGLAAVALVMGLWQR